MRKAKRSGLPRKMVIGGREEETGRWYRIAGERNVVTFKLEWTTVCVAESRVGSLSSAGRTEPVVCTRGSLAHVATNTVRTHGRRIVFKTAGGSQALEPSCDLVLPQRPGPIALRLQAEFQYTRIFNEPPPFGPSPRVFLIPEVWSSSSSSFFSSSSHRVAASTRLSFFSTRDTPSGSLDTRRTRSLDRGIGFLYFPAAKRAPGLLARSIYRRLILVRFLFHA